MHHQIRTTFLYFFEPFNFARYGPNPGWMQYDDSIDVDEEGNIVAISGFPLNESMIYRVGSFIDLHIGKSIF